MHDGLSPLVSTQWLQDHLSAPDVRVVDATYYLPNENKNARELYQASHIEKAVFFDIDDICADDSSLPHMLPSEIKFASRVRKLGLGDGNRIIVYDQRGLFSAARVWWMFKLFGHRDVAVLDGGLPKWLKEFRPVDDNRVYPEERHFTPRFNNFLVRDKEQILRNLTTGREQVLDARAAERFSGSVAEPRVGLRSGHIPGSLNLPFTRLHQEDGSLKAVSELKELFEKAGVDYSKPVITSCGSGVTAAVLSLGLELTGHKAVSLYDGSWSEWGLEGETPVETRP
ncbi:3-mercaptopyruvate sulfurtransferase [Kiloniella laminariae]|uniref:Sulfurtransferase n=1 Tax=Kiloniella laminariae TaxID=454162 RepID=A0ABT4LNE1_9PROT|nr:3-mercaptopyruvate sulfurtransferase [Kiloniella laminariae]MCZ4282653.1 3-mercaptopyruvate sulfurtransferase [Kiloniella laminariae]